MQYFKNDDLNYIRFLIRILINKKPSLLLILCFVNFLKLRLLRFSRFKIRLNFLEEREFKHKIHEYCNDKNLYVDSNSCAFGNVAHDKEFATWCYLCTFISPKRYKILIINLECIPKDNIYVSNVMKFNIENALMIDSKISSYYVYSPVENNVMYATEVVISQITNAYDCPNDYVDSLLKNYFCKPRYLRSQDVFSVQIKEYCPDYYYLSIQPNNTTIYFKVKNIKSKNVNESFHGFYVVQDKTTLILERAIQNYLPKAKTNFSFNNFNVMNPKTEIKSSECPPCFEDSLRHLKASIFPFLQKDVRINLNPMFLIEGSEGSGKFKLVQIVSRQLGLHLYDVDFREIQTLTSVQTEAKFRIAIYNAKDSLPCILCFRNIQVFGINAEGKKDDRIISAFETEIKRVFNEKGNYPLIVIATSESLDLSAKLKRLFLETICLNHLNLTQRSNTLSYLLESKGILNKPDLQKIIGLCSDFVLADFEALILHGVKTKYNIKTLPRKNEQCDFTDEDFNNAYEYMKPMLSDHIGTPHVPKVYWKDIGGIGDLKQEIIKRIELPLLYNIEIGQSGLLLYGPPGTGKTLLAKAVATECQLHFFSIKGPELLNMYVGQSEKNVRQVFERAKAAAPCIIFFDELDSLAPNRGQSGDSGGVMDRVVSQLLAEMDGLESSNNIFIIGATNRPDLIDPALLRPGRFDKMLYVGIYSDKNSQISVLQALTRKFKMKNNGTELETLVDELPFNVTGADLYSICSNAWLLAVRKTLKKLTNTTGQAIEKDFSQIHGEIVVELEDFVTAARDMTPSVSSSELIKYQKLRDKTKENF